MANVKLSPETLLHIQFCDYLQLQYRGIKIHHSPNEGKRSYFIQWLIKRMRVSKGFSDLLLIWNGKCCVIELKATKMGINGKLVRTSSTSEEQKSWVESFNEAGIPAKVCIGFDEAQKFVTSVFGK